MAFSRSLSALRSSIIFLGLVWVCDLANACDGDQYWSEPRRVKTWILRNTVSFKAPNSVVSDQFLRQALINAHVTPCSDFEKDLTGQDVQVEKALRSDVFFSPWQSEEWINVRDFGQVMARLLTRSSDQGVIEILTRSKRQQGTSVSHAHNHPDAPLIAALAQRVVDQIEKQFNGIGRNK